MTKLGLFPLFVAMACAGTGPRTEPASARAPDEHSAAPRKVSTPPPPTPGAAPVPAGASTSQQAFRDCGPLACKAFATTEAAFDYVLSGSPRVLAIGEAHAQSTGAKSASTTRRFMDTLLPRLAPKASDLVIELWVANGSCGSVEQKVQKQQAAVTAPQAATNQNEFMELGHRAKALEIQPHALVPTCEQYAKISSAGSADVEEMLRMLKDVTQRDVEKLLAQRDQQRLIVAYGGAMHNDLTPRAGREPFSFGPELGRASGGRYIELDLILPEQIKDSDAWRSLPWYAAYARAAESGEAQNGEAFLYMWAPQAYALIFPKS